MTGKGLATRIKTKTKNMGNYNQKEKRKTLPLILHLLLLKSEFRNFSSLISGTGQSDCGLAGIELAPISFLKCPTKFFWCRLVKLDDG